MTWFPSLSLHYIIVEGISKIKWTLWCAHNTLGKLKVDTRELHNACCPHTSGCQNIPHKIHKHTYHDKVTTYPTTSTKRHTNNKLPTYIYAMKKKIHLTNRTRHNKTIRSIAQPKPEPLFYYAILGPTREIICLTHKGQTWYKQRGIICVCLFIV